MIRPGIFNYETRGRREKGRVTTDHTDRTDKRKQRGGAKRANGLERRTMILPGFFNYETRGRRERGSLTTDHTDRTDKRRKEGARSAPSVLNRL